MTPATMQDVLNCLGAIEEDIRHLPTYTGQLRQMLEQAERRERVFGDKIASELSTLSHRIAALERRAKPKKKRKR